MDNQRREELDHRKKTDSKNNFFDEKAVVYDTIGSAGETICKVEPGKHPYNQPEDKRKIINRLGFEAYLKDKPEDSNGGGGLYKGPQDPQCISHIPLFEIIFGQFPQKGSTLPNSF